MRLKGRITQWQDARGFGFIQPALGGEQVFVHVRDINARRPVGGEIVTYELKRDAKGRRHAANVRLSGAQTKPTPRPSSNRLPPLLAAAVLVAVSALALVGRLPAYVPLAYVALSALTFMAYWQDKWSAKQKTWRTP